jgi:hypothetical protein
VLATGWDWIWTGKETRSRGYSAKIKYVCKEDDAQDMLVLKNSDLFEATSKRILELSKKIKANTQDIMVWKSVLATLPSDTDET